MLNSLDIPKPPKDTRVVVAMSGGVDSSVVAAMLAEEGYEAIGITLQLYDHGAAIHKKGACCAGQDIHDARRAAERLSIPHYVLDYESRFRQGVIDAFADSYLAGETPVPCIECNRKVKFRDLLAMARGLGADALATGHYVASRAMPDGRRGLFRAADSARDQSYFLYATSQVQLDYLRFPLGGISKDATREIARRHGLAIADKPDSQDICFVPEGRYADVIAKLRPEAIRPGEIVSLSGEVLGRHEGIIHFTIGQRRGLGLASGEPLYVTALDAANARVVAGPREALKSFRFALRDVNWLGDAPLGPLDESPVEAAVRVRSARAPKPARIGLAGGSVHIEIAGGEEAVAPGQACVIYASEEPGARVLGGGVICRNEKNAFLQTHAENGARSAAARQAV